MCFVFVIVLVFETPAAAVVLSTNRASGGFGSKVPYMVVPGNHEAECHSPACLFSPRKLRVSEKQRISEVNRRSLTMKPLRVCIHVCVCVFRRVVCVVYAALVVGVRASRCYQRVFHSAARWLGTIVIIVPSHKTSMGQTGRLRDRAVYYLQFVAQTETRVYIDSSRVIDCVSAC